MDAKKVIAVFGFFVIFLTVSSTAAQYTEFQPGQLLADLKDRFNLTADQATQIRPIMKEQSEKLRALVEKYKGQGFLGMRSLRDEVQQLREETKMRLETILTEEQMNELKAFQDELREKIYEKIRDRIISGLAERLNLTEEQAAEILPILENNINKRRELVEKYREQGRKAFRDFRNEHQKLQEDTQKRLEVILTEEQMQEFKTFQEELQEKIRKEIFKR